jgi:hypothetical protein
MDRMVFYDFAGHNNVKRSGMQVKINRFMGSGFKGSRVRLHSSELLRW